MSKIKSDEIQRSSVARMADPSKEDMDKRINELIFECQNYPVATAKDFAALEVEYWKIRKEYDRLQERRISA